MRKLLGAAHLARNAYWTTRRTLGMPPGNRHEAMASLRALQRRLDALSGGVFRFDWGDVEFTKLGSLCAQFEEIFVNRHYAFSADSPSPVIVDCGGNIGLSAIWFRQTYPESRLTVYEPDQELYDVLQRNLRRAGVTGITIHNCAVWTKNAAALAFQGRSDDTGRIDSAGTMTVQAIDLAEALPDDVDLLKLDIEGAEYAVLNHLCGTGAIRRVKSMVCEFHVTRERTGELLSTLGRLREAGLELSMTANVASWTGLEKCAAPFDLVDRKTVFMNVYAWRQNRCT